jgi:hypothetical protein
MLFVSLEGLIDLISTIYDFFLFFKEILHQLFLLLKVVKMLEFLVIAVSKVELNGYTEIDFQKMSHFLQILLAFKVDQKSLCLSDKFLGAHRDQNL